MKIRPTAWFRISKTEASSFASRPTTALCRWSPSSVDRGGPFTSRRRPIRAKAAKQEWSNVEAVDRDPALRSIRRMTTDGHARCWVRAASLDADQTFTGAIAMRTLFGAALVLAIGACGTKDPTV